MQVVSGRAEAPEGSGGSFAGHRILLTYRRSVALGGQPQEPPAGAEQPPADADGIELPEAASAPVATDGRFRLNLPDLSELREPLEIAVLAPSGVILEHNPLKLRQLESDLTVAATPAQPFVVRPSDDPTLGQAKRITGRVVGRDG